MTSNEVMVLIVFGLLGYWIVSFFLERKSVAQAAERPRAWHQVLNVDADASVDEIRAAYRALAGQRKSDEIDAAYREAMRSRGAPD